MHEAQDEKASQTKSDGSNAETHVHGPDCDHSHGPSVPYRRTEAKVGRNEPCPCGSGKKYKKCHG